MSSLACASRGRLARSSSCLVLSKCTVHHGCAILVIHMEGHVRVHAGHSRSWSSYTGLHFVLRDLAFDIPKQRSVSCVLSACLYLALPRCRLPAEMRSRLTFSWALWLLFSSLFCFPRLCKVLLLFLPLGGQSGAEDRLRAPAVI